ncbi:MAG: T9SS type A sorting domain-containing protein, partial [Bacteroidia bacterium]|nr:T9SS type A sorting domain-containing protein [Bacteroidia bacterium]
WHTQNPVGAGGFNAIYEDITAANFFPIVVNQSTTVTGASPEAFGSVFPLIPNQPVDWIRAFNIEPNFECLATNACNDLPCNPCDSELDEDIAEGNIQNNPYTSETIWMLQSELYARLNRDSILLNSDSLYQAFYANMQNDNIAQFETINEELLDLYELDATVYTNLQNNNNSVEQLMSQLANKMEQMQDETLSTQQLAALQTEITGLQQNIANLIAYNNTAIELAQSSQTLTTANMEANNDAIVSSETIEVNTQEVNDIYLNTLAEGITEFSTSQENSLFSIANQCPLEGGAAVFMARSMYYLIDRTAHYDDRWLCLQEGIILREQNVDISSNNFNVYPNPANNELTVTYSIEEEETTIFELYDGIGKKLIRSTLDKNDNTIIIDVSNIKNGIYFYKIVSNNKNVKNGKIIISR